jgi:hypothetical protein
MLLSEGIQWLSQNFPGTVLHVFHWQEPCGITASNRDDQRERDGKVLVTAHVSLLNVSKRSQEAPRGFSGYLECKIQIRTAF